MLLPGKIESDPKFQHCRLALALFQKHARRKGILWIRHLNNPLLKGFMVDELKSMSPKSLKKVAHAEFKKILTSSSSTGHALDSFRIVFLECEADQDILESSYAGYSDRMISKLLEDCNLRVCHCFFNTWCGKDSDSCVSTPLHFPMPTHADLSFP